MLVIEDLHWADRATRDFLSFLLRSARRERLVLVATYRADELHRRHPLRPFLAEAERLDGRRADRAAPLLPAGACRSADRASSAPTPTPAVADALFERSGGNPFFAEELLAATGDGNGSALPETLRDALMVRVEALPGRHPGAAARDRRLRPRRHARAARARPSSEGPALIEALREAMTHHVLVQRHGSEGYAFRHALMREAVYEDLLPGERGDLHVRLAEALSADPSLSADGAGPAAELAWHWFQAHDLPRALAASIQAAGQAERMRAPADAARHLENAVDLWGRVDVAEQTSGTTLVELLRRAARLTYLAGDVDRAAALGQRVLELIGDSDPVAAGMARARQGRYLWTSGRHAEAADEYARAVELMPAEPPSPERANVLASLAQVLMLRGDLAESLELAEQAIEIARAAGDRITEAHALNTKGVDIASLGDRPRASPTCARRSRSRRVSGPPTTCSARTRTCPTSSTRTAPWRRASTSRWRAYGSPASRG